MGKEVCQSGMPFFLAQKPGRYPFFGLVHGREQHRMAMKNSRKVRLFMNKKRIKRIAAMMMAVVLTVCAATPTGSFAFASGADTQSQTVEEAVIEESRELELYDSTLRKELEALEIATAVDIVVAAGYGFDVEHDFEGI